MKSLYYIKVPAGFHKKDLPLMKVRVRLHGEAQQSIYVKYSDVKDRFPKQLCDFLEQHVVFRRRTDDSNIFLDSEEEAARQREWMRSISRQQQQQTTMGNRTVLGEQLQQRQSTLQVQSKVVEESVVGSKRLHRQRGR